MPCRPPLFWLFLPGLWYGNGLLQRDHLHGVEWVKQKGLHGGGYSARNGLNSILIYDFDYLLVLRIILVHGVNLRLSRLLETAAARSLDQLPA